MPRPDPILDAAGRVRYPGQRAAHERELDLLVDAAGRFWDQRNVHGARPTLGVADSLIGEDANPWGRGWSPGSDVPGQVVLDGRYTGARLAELRSNRPRARVRAVKGLYDLLIHEVGHSRGLEHTTGGIMDPALPVVAGDWKTVARQLGVTEFPVPRRRRLHNGPGFGEG